MIVKFKRKVIDFSHGSKAVIIPKALVGMLELQKGDSLVFKCDFINKTFSLDKDDDIQMALFENFEEDTQNDHTA